jgi:hypothetical protein
MLIKGLILYSALYIAGAASSLVAVHQIAPARHAVLVKSESVFGQVVNRSLKGNRLPIQHGLPQAHDKLHYMVPAADGLGMKLNIRCERPKADFAMSMAAVLPMRAVRATKMNSLDGGK